jgi:hypothetical protein
MVTFVCIFLAKEKELNFMNHKSVFPHVKNAEQKNALGR